MITFRTPGSQKRFLSALFVSFCTCFEHVSILTTVPGPAKPPRVDIYAEGNALCHPLISPLAANDWKGAPPVYFACGEELLADEARAVACRMARQKVFVVWEQYESMP